MEMQVKSDAFPMIEGKKRRDGSKILKGFQGIPSRFQRNKTRSSRIPVEILKIPAEIPRIPQRSLRLNDRISRDPA